jgi:hypothetical protein
MLEAPATREELTDLLFAKTQNFCLRGEIAAVAAWRRKNPWRWARVLPKWFVDMKREDLLKQIHAKEKNMLMVSGTAEFKNEGKVLETVLRIQPQFEKQHELLTKVAEIYGEIGGVKMEKGMLVITRSYVVADLAPAVQEAASSQQSESSSTSAAEVPPANPSGSLGSGLTTEEKSSAPAIEKSGEGEASGAVAPAAAPAQALPAFMPGDRVQWISQGAYHFAEPQHILRLSEDGKFAFFEGSETGVPVEQLELEPEPA